MLPHSSADFIRNILAFQRILFYTSFQHIETRVDEEK